VRPHPISSIMKTGIAGIVHIVPLAQEFDRAVRPFDSAAANRVHIVADAGGNAYAARVVRYLKKKHIPAEIVPADFTDMADLVRTIASVIRHEQESGNTVYVNMSAGGELAAAAATMAGMALGAEVYCVHADRYATDAERKEAGISVCTAAAVSMLPKVDVRIPDEAELPVLEELYHADDNVLSASEIGDVVDTDDREYSLMTCDCDVSLTDEEKKICMAGSDAVFDRWEQRRVQSRNLMKVSGMMKRMEEKGYVTKSKTGRKMMYRLTERGRYALILSGHIR